MNNYDKNKSYFEEILSVIAKSHLDFTSNQTLGVQLGMLGNFYLIASFSCPTRTAVVKVALIIFASIVASTTAHFTATAIAKEVHSGCHSTILKHSWKCYPHVIHLVAFIAFFGGV